MQKPRLFTIVLISLSLIAIYGCKDTSPRGEHEGEGEGEESGPRLAIDKTYDAVRKGVRLILAYDSASSAFTGTVENVTDQTISSVRVEVHLSNGTELGPTSRTELAPGDKEGVNLPAGGQCFAWWKAHAETGEGEHGEEHERETGGEHGGEREHGDGGD